MPGSTRTDTVITYLWGFPAAVIVLVTVVAVLAGGFGAELFGGLAAMAAGWFSVSAAVLALCYVWTTGPEWVAPYWSVFVMALCGVLAIVNEDLRLGSARLLDVAFIGKYDPFVGETGRVNLATGPALLFFFSAPVLRRLRLPTPAARPVAKPPTGPRPTAPSS